MAELLGTMIEALGLMLQSLAGEAEQLFAKKSKRQKSTENWVTR